LEVKTAIKPIFYSTYIIHISSLYDFGGISQWKNRNVLCSVDIVHVYDKFKIIWHYFDLFYVLGKIFT